MKTLTSHLVVIGALLLLALGFVYAGAFNVAADEPHWPLTQRLLETARERSIATRADEIEVPNLEDPALLSMGAEHYSAMCTGCHLAPGEKSSELRQGLYPQPPDLSRGAARRSPEEAFWIIKHGLKMTGMPAWGLTHDDRSIWGMVAFLEELPGLSQAQYQELVAQGSGHEHDAADPDASPDEPAPAHDHSTHSHDEAKAPAAAGSPLAGDTAEPVAVVERFFQLLASGDTRSASGLLDPSVVIFESGGAERSRAEYASHHLGADSQFLKTVKHELLSRTGDARGDLAWVATESRLTASGKQPADLVSTETMVLRKAQGGWRIVHIHWSSRPMQPAAAGKT